MHKTYSHHQRKNNYSWFYMIVLLAALLHPSAISAQSPTAKINSLRGAVSVKLQGKESQPATTGMVLSAGDSIQAQKKAVVGAFN